MPHAASLPSGSPRALVVYTSTHGHTARVAERLGAELSECHVTPDVRELSHAGRVDLRDYDVVVVAGSVHAGHHQHELVTWLTEHHTQLNQRPSAFFSVSLTAAEDSEEARAATRALIDELLDATGWIPARSLPVAGALQYLEYSFPTRVLMRLIAGRHDQPTDVEADVDYTDWPALGAEAREVAALVADRQPVG